MEIITLIENEKLPGRKELHAEAGLSLFIKTGSRNILFDTGSSGKFAANAEKLGVDLKQVDFVVISHAHYDHTGGLAEFFRINKTAKVYIKKEAYGEYYYKVLFFNKYIGVDQEILKKYTDRFVFLDNDIVIDPNIRIITRFLNKYKLPSDSKHILKKENGKLLPDDFSHELMLMISEGNKEFVFTGCSHHGILNMIKTAENHTDKKLTVVGGLHMYNPVTGGLAEKSEDVLNVATEIIRDRNIQQVITGHCTGLKAYKLMQTLMNEKLINMRTGRSFSL